ncbi:HTH-type transcriptional activator AllS [Herbaspirillum sp. HC18]|nr:HTH-type transcriptional activator AllS [Herbaspirillum sp. HC18]
MLSLDPIRAQLGQDELRTFLTVAQLHSFSAAAEALHKSTSAISYRIKMLEESLDVHLFVRTTRTVTLTPAGEFLFEKASEIFDWLHALPEQVQACSKGVESVFTLVINNLLYDAEGVAALLAHLTQRFPLTQFNIRRQVYMGVWDEMLNNAGHMALGAPGFDSMNDKLQAMPLGTVRWVFAVAPGHPLTQLSRTLSDDDLRRYPAINVEDTARHLVKRIAWKLPRQQELLVPNMLTKIEAHKAGLGVGFLPEHKVQALVEKKLLVICSVQSGRKPSPLSLVWRPEGAGQVLNTMLDLVRARDPLIQCFLAPIDPAPQRDAS